MTVEVDAWNANVSPVPRNTARVSGACGAAVRGSPGTALAPVTIMRMPFDLVWRMALAGLAVMLIVSGAGGQPIDANHIYRLDTIAGGISELRERFTSTQLEILEKLNRADLESLGRSTVVMVPVAWADDELAYAQMPKHYPSGETFAKLVIVHLPGQMFGAYEAGGLVRWGPVSSGARETPTTHGLFHLNWRAVGHTSTVNPDWFMRWYFNFGNREGLALHQYALPGRPASHGCVRLLERDARWLFEWGEAWTLNASQDAVIRAGTPVIILGQYDFDAPPPWRSPAWLSQAVSLPLLPPAAIRAD